MKHNYDWPRIFELIDSGHPPYRIAKIPGMPSRQAISKALKKRNQSVNQTGGRKVTVRQSTSLRVCTAENKDIILGRLATGSTYKMAAACVAVGDRALRDWRAEDPEFAAACEAARAVHKAQMAGHITDAAARDWKAAAWHLEHSPDTKEEFGKQERSDAPVQVILHINRGNGDDPKEKDVSPHIIELPACKTDPEDGSNNSE